MNISDFEKSLTVSLEQQARLRFVEDLRTIRTRISTLLEELNGKEMTEALRPTKQRELKRLQSKLKRIQDAEIARQNQAKHAKADGGLFSASVDVTNPIADMNLDEMFPAAQAPPAKSFPAPSTADVVAAYERHFEASQAAESELDGIDGAEEEEEGVAHRFRHLTFDTTLPMHVVDGTFRVPYVWHNLLKYQQDGVRWMWGLFQRGVGGILADDMGLGKGHPHGTPLLTPDGWVPVEEVGVGHTVVGSDGRPTRVTGVFRRGTLPVHRVTLVDGGSVDVDGDHLWHVTPIDGGPARTMETRALAALSPAELHRLAIPTVAPVVFTGDDAPADLPAARAAGQAVRAGRAASIPTHAPRPAREAFLSGLGPAPLPGPRPVLDAVLDVGRGLGRLGTIAPAPPVLTWLPPGTPRTVDAITPLPPAEVTCISVAAPDRLYVAASHAVTHNTVQVAALLAGLHASSRLPPTLVVCPASVLMQWARTLTEWWPLLKITILHGTTGQTPVAALRSFAAGGRHVMITTYATLALHLRPVQKAAGWGLIVVDEGHVIKNPDTRITKALKSFACPRRLLLTGTPIQNGLTELWSLFDFAYPGRLGTNSVFQQQFGVPIALGTYKSANATQIQCARACAVSLRELVRPLLLRRTKAVVKAELPLKDEKVLFIRLSPVQRALYKSYLGGPLVGSLLKGKAPAGSVYTALSALRQIATHPDLLPPGPAAEVGHAFPEDERGAVARSSKLDALLRLLARWHAAGDRVLVFTQSRAMLDIIEGHVATLYRSSRIDGQTPVPTRMRLIDEFNAGGPDAPFVFLLTTRACGVGVDLLGANRVVIFSPDWNPQVDTQARDRCWRLGQSRPVSVVRLVTKGTVEHRILEKQLYKKILADRILARPDARASVEVGGMKELLSFDETGDAVAPDGAGKRKISARQREDRQTPGPGLGDAGFLGLETGDGAGFGAFPRQIAREAITELSRSAKAPSGGELLDRLRDMNAPEEAPADEMAADIAIDEIDGFLLRRSAEAGGATLQEVLEHTMLPRTPEEIARLEELLGGMGYYLEDDEVWVHHDV